MPLGLQRLDDGVFVLGKYFREAVGFFDTFYLRGTQVLVRVIVEKVSGSQDVVAEAHSLGDLGGDSGVTN